jgi:outer membrane protein OmpA-like peptidoglycan-associated protein
MATVRSIQRFSCVLVCSSFGLLSVTANAQFLDKLKQKAAAAVSGNNSSQPAASTSQPTAPAATTPGTTPNATSGATSATGGSSDSASVTAYQNYDFTPGDKIVFFDDFVNTQDGEFPDQWELKAGQAVVNKQQGYPSFLLTDGNYAIVTPRVKLKSYLGPEFTVEYDVFQAPGAYGLSVFFFQGGDRSQLSTSASESEFQGPVRFAGSLPEAARGSYEGKWHHIAISYRKQQIKVYVDQNRVLVVPDTKMVPDSIGMGGIGSQDHPLVFRNIRIASGGSMNMIGKKFTDAKIVTHGINFDVDRATLRPESMGVLNQIKSVMAADPTLTFEVDGFTDNSGASAHNQALSQQRADAVKSQLVTMGVDAGRLTTKGYGDAKPMDTNDTMEGKANNRRVEFLRTSAASST